MIRHHSAVAWTRHVKTKPSWIGCLRVETQTETETLSKELTSSGVRFDDRGEGQGLA